METNENQDKQGGVEQSYEVQLAQMRKTADEYKDTLQRLQAEFENFRKRLDKEKAEFSLFAGMEIVADFLPLMDSLGEGLKEAKKSENSQMATGFEKIKEQLRRILEKNGIVEIESVGKKFDLAMHECILTADEKDTEDGIVLEEFRKGYLINGKVLRPAKVKVNKREVAK